VFPRRFLCILIGIAGSAGAVAAPTASAVPGPAVATVNTPFTLASVDRCFSVPPPPGGTSWPFRMIGRVHGIRGSFNEPRGRSIHFGVDVQAPKDRAPIFAISSGYVSDYHPGVHHIRVTVAAGHTLWYWHIVVLGTVYRGMPLYRGELIGHAVAAYHHVHIAETYAGCGWINPMRPGGPLAVRVNTEQPVIRRLHAYVADANAFRRFSIGRNPATETDPATPLALDDPHGLVDLRAEIHDWPVREMGARPQLELEVAAIRGYLAPKSDPSEHLGRMKNVFDGATLLNPARMGTTLWHIWAFGTWRDSSGYFDSGPNADTHLGAAYVWHVGGTSGLHTNQFRNGAYQYCVEALTINGRHRIRCTPVVIHN
jgi:hypothetical protein